MGRGVRLGVSRWRGGERCSILVVLVRLALVASLLCFREKIQREIFQGVFVDIIDAARPCTIVADGDELIRGSWVERNECKLAP